MATSSTVLVLVAILCAVDIRVEAACCPTLWTLYGDYCYRYFGDRVTWSEAEAACNQYCNQAHTAHLASVADDDENIFLYKLFKSSIGDTPDWVYDFNNRHDVYGVWIGLHQETNGAAWTYTDGSTHTYRDWKTNEPNDSYYQGEQNEDCVHLWRRNAADDTAVDKWNDMYCNEVMEYICKVTAIPA